MSIHRSKARDHPGDEDKWPGRRPSRSELLEAYGSTIPDLVGPGCRVLLVGINPSLYSGWAGLHFARPGNRLWRTLAEAGFTDRVLHPTETDALMAAGLGVTNLVARATARADELTADELVAGARELERRVATAPPHVVAILGITAYRIAFGIKQAVPGEQAATIAGVPIWVVPNPSGLNAHATPAALATAYRAAAIAAGIDVFAEPA